MERKDFIDLAYNLLNEINILPLITHTCYDVLYSNTSKITFVFRKIHFQARAYIQKPLLYFAYFAGEHLFYFQYNTFF